MKSNDGENIGEVKCDICGMSDYIDLNDMESLYRWTSEHILGHVGTSINQKAFREEDSII